MMKKIACILALAGLLVACEKDPVIPEPVYGVDGAWELSSVSTKASVGGVTVSVYLAFDSAGTFSLYQKIGEGRYTVFSGKWQLKDDNTLSGTYSGGASWGPYAAEITSSTLTLTSPGGKEVDTYKKIASIPDSVTQNTY